MEYLPEKRGTEATDIAGWCVSDTAQNIEPMASLASQALRELLRNAESIRALMELEETPLTMEDVLRRVPWSRPVVEDMIHRGQIPMVKIKGRWIISRKQFREALERNFAAPKNYRPRRA